MAVVYGDCYEEMERLISKNIKMDLIILDPPYEVQSNGGWTVNTIKKLNKSLNNGIVKDNLVKWYDYNRAFELLDKLQDNINIYFFCSKKQIMTYMNRYVNEKKKCTFDIIMWHKKNALPTYFNKYLTDCEYILHFRKWAKCKPESYEDAKTIFLWEINHKDKKTLLTPVNKTNSITRENYKKFIESMRYSIWLLRLKWKYLSCSKKYRKKVLSCRKWIKKY